MTSDTPLTPPVNKPDAIRERLIAAAIAAGVLLLSHLLAWVRGEAPPAPPQAPSVLVVTSGPTPAIYSALPTAKGGSP